MVRLFTTLVNRLPSATDATLYWMVFLIVLFLVSLRL